jgi:hypothetical protein
MFNYNGYFKILFLRNCIFFTLLVLPISANTVKRFNIAISGLMNNNLSMVDKAFLKVGLKSGNDQLLALYELGSFYHLSGNFKKSIDFFNMADNVAHIYEDKALISVNSMRRYASSVLVNDSLMRYEGFSHDKVMSRTLNAVNYIFAGDTEGSRVELRKAEEYQRLNRERHQHKNINSKDSRLIGIAANLSSRLADSDTDLNESVITRTYGRMFDYANNSYHSFENVFTYFFASQIYLAQGEQGIDDAMVSIKRAYELMPHVPSIRSAYLEIARAHSKHAYDDAKMRLRIVNDCSIKDSKNSGSVVVCFATGQVPNMELVKMPFVVSDIVYTLTFPIYNNFNVIQTPLVIQTPTDTVTTTTITDIRCLAIRSLQERMPELIGRSLLSAITKAEIQREMTKHVGSFAGFLAGVAGLSTSSADCRSWLSLPAELQIAKFNLDAGSNKLILQNSNWIESLILDVKAGSNTLILVRSLPGFRRIDVKII